MNVLTTDRRAKSQLSLLLHDLGVPPKFAGSASELNEHLLSSKTLTTVLIDIQDVSDEIQIERLKSEYPNTKFIGFDLFERTSGNQTINYNRSLDSCVIIPSHAERAKVRLRAAIKPPVASGSKKATALTSFKRANPPRSAFKKANKAPSFLKQQPIETKSRYLTSISPAIRAFVEKLRRYDSSKHNSLIFRGEDGVEFELVAREFNYSLNADQSPLLIMDGDEITLDVLEKIEREANQAQKKVTCYVGRSDEIDSNTATELALMIEYLDNLRNPHMHIVIAHPCGEDLYFRNDVEHLVDAICSKQPVLHIPGIDARAEDIPSICNSVLANLRTAHPFLLVRSITEGAIQHLVESRAELNHGKLIRVLRNAIALAQRSSLSVEDLKNYGESDMTTQHLLESMADETFFPTSLASNS